MQATFDQALAALLVHEGGYSDEAQDDGGPTNFGITLADVRRFLKHDATADDVRALTREKAAAIYRSKYWAVMRCDDLPAGLDYCVFDYGVNSGIARAGSVLRLELGLMASANMIDDETVAAARGADAITVINAICEQRLAFLHRAVNDHGVPLWPIYGKGWGQRVADVNTLAVQMVHDAAASAIA